MVWWLHGPSSLVVAMALLLHILSLLVITAAQQKPCNLGSSCIENSQCPQFLQERELLRSLNRASPEFRDKLDRLKSLVCNRQEKKVCCVKDVVDENNSPSWVPGKEDGCGVGTSSAGFVVGGNNTALGEFPWVVLLGQRYSSGRTVWKCGGTLINRWYVVTAAHCKNSMDVVRVGEWEVVDTENIKTTRFSFKCTAYNPNQCENLRCSESCNVVDGEVDCVEGTDICSEKIQDVDVDEVKIHEEYQITKTGIAVNDIALVKLKQPIELNKFVVPVCLPTKDENILHHVFGEDENKDTLSNGRPVVVGWGRTYEDTDKDIRIVSSARQQMLDMPVVSNKECSTIWDTKFAGANVGDDILKDEHICAGGEIGKDSCNGDSGGPLLGRDDDTAPYALVGIVSGGTSRCGTGAPGIFTRVAHYREWILSNLV